MEKAIVTLCKALAHIINAHYRHYDRETSDLVRALAEWVRKNEG